MNLFIFAESDTPSQLQSTATVFNINEIFSGELEIDDIETFGKKNYDVKETVETKNEEMATTEVNFGDEIDDKILLVGHFILFLYSCTP